MYYLIGHQNFNAFVEWKDEVHKFAIDCESCTKEYQGFQDLGVTHSDNRVKDMWFMV